MPLIEEIYINSCLHENVLKIFLNFFENFSKKREKTYSSETFGDVISGKEFHSKIFTVRTLMLQSSSIPGFVFINSVSDSALKKLSQSLPCCRRTLVCFVPGKDTG